MGGGSFHLKHFDLHEYFPKMAKDLDPVNKNYLTQMNFAATFKDLFTESNNPRKTLLCSPAIYQVFLFVVSLRQACLI
jgi:hypothetical protein